MLVMLTTTELPQLWVSLQSAASDIPRQKAHLLTQVRHVLERAGAHYVLPQSEGTWLARFDNTGQLQAGIRQLNQGLEFQSPHVTKNVVCLNFRAAYLTPDSRLHQGIVAPSLYLKAALSLPPTRTPIIDAAVATAGVSENFLHESMLRHELYDALAHQRFYLVYQPLVSLSHGHVMSAEALLRIKDCPFGPTHFIPVAEELGLIDEVGEIALRLASDFRQVVRQRYPHINLAVNVSAAQLGTPSFSTALGKLPSPTAGQSLELEITESLLLGATASQHLHRLKEQGYPLAMDDFGAGAASLVQLLRTPLGKVKFDSSLLHLTARAPSQLKHLVDLAHEKGCSVVVEGIETPEQLSHARAAGADYGQGYLFDRPLSEADFQARLEQQFCLEHLCWKIQ